MLYLVQHGEAVSKEVDADRPLSAQGVAEVTRLAAFLASSIQKHLKVDQIAGINPNDPVDVFAARLGAMPLPVMIVGHLPFMSRLVSHLVIQHDDPAIVAYQPGSVVCLEKDMSQAWSVSWMLRPALLVEK